MSDIKIQYFIDYWRDLTHKNNSIENELAQKEHNRSYDFFPIIENRTMMIRFVDGRNVEPEFGQRQYKKSSKKKI